MNLTVYFFTSMICLFNLVSTCFARPLSTFKPMSGHKVGFFTGTFNPVHSRHAEIVKGLIDKGLVDAVAIIPNDMTYHKANVLDISDRIQMLNYQFEDGEHIYVPDSVAFGGSSFIPMELRMRAYLHKLNPAIQYFGIIGADCVDSRSVKMA